VALGTVLEKIQHLEARYRDLEAGTLELAGITHAMVGPS
jgi:hypothetical protein